MNGAPLFDIIDANSIANFGQRSAPARLQRGDSRELEVGKAAEHLVCADLLLKGYSAFLSDQGLPYDVIIDLRDRLIRVQVKGTRKPKNPMPGLRISDGYFFHIRKAGRGSRRLYRGDEFDVYALVALDIRHIAYFSRADLEQQTVCLRVPGVSYGPGGKSARQFSEAGLERALRGLGARPAR